MTGSGRPFKDKGLWLLVSCLAGLVLATALVVTTKPYGTLARNSLLVGPPARATFDWNPAAPPDGYKVEPLEAPDEIQAAAATALGAERESSAGNFESAIALAAYLGDNPRVGGALRKDTVTTFNRIRDEGRGYCADYTQAFMALALAAGIPVREWGFGLEGFGSGHAFNEVFSPRYGKWVFIDPFIGFYAVDRRSGTPLSVVEFNQHLDDPNALEAVDILPIDERRAAYKDDSAALAYYARAQDYFYVFWGETVFSYDRDPWVRAASRLSRAIEIVVGIARGVQPQIAPLTTMNNQDDIRLLFLVRYGLFGLFALMAALTLAAIARLLACLLRNRRSDG